MQLVHLGGAAGARTGPGRARNVDQTNARASENPGGKEEGGGKIDEGRQRYLLLAITTTLVVCIVCAPRVRYEVTLNPYPRQVELVSSRIVVRAHHVLVHYIHIHVMYFTY